jgi:hypothetical protein
MKMLEGYRTIGCIILSLVLSILARKGVVVPDGVSAGVIWDTIMGSWESVSSVVAALMAIYFKLRAPKPGPLAPAEGKKK